MRTKGHREEGGKSYRDGKSLETKKPKEIYVCNYVHTLDFLDKLMGSGVTGRHRKLTAESARRERRERVEME